MASRTATTVGQYLASLPPERRAAISAVRDAVNASLPRGYQEVLQYNMISWIVPASRLPETYNGQPLALACLASQKQHMALYLMSIYGDPALARWFASAYQRSGKKLDMGKSCMRFTTVAALALDVIGEAVARVPVDAYVARYHASRSPKARAKPVATASATKAKPKAKPNARPTRRTTTRSRAVAGARTTRPRAAAATRSR